MTTQTGLRVSELIGLRRQDAHLGAGAHLRCHGKGRKNRVTPLTAATVAALRNWLAERGGDDADPIFCTRSGHPLSRDAIEQLVTKHATTAAARTRPWLRNTFPRIPCGTPRPWHCCTPVSTSR